MQKVYAPFTAEQVENLKVFQLDDMVHPFTCCDHLTMSVTHSGMHCKACGRIQTWVWDAMADGSMVRLRRQEIAADDERNGAERFDGLA